MLAVLTGYVFSLARFDTDFDVRDRARMLTALLVGVSPHLQQSNGSTADTVSWDSVAEPDRGGVILRREQVRVVLFEGKLSVHEGRDDLGKGVLYYRLQSLIPAQTPIAYSGRWN